MGDAPTELIAKSVECPEKLTYADFIALDAYLFTSMNIVYRNYELAKEGLFTQSDWKSEADDYVHWYLGDTFSRTWWNGAENPILIPSSLIMPIVSLRKRASIRLELGNVSALTWAMRRRRSRQ